MSGKREPWFASLRARAEGALRVKQRPLDEFKGHGNPWQEKDRQVFLTLGVVEPDQLLALLDIAEIADEFLRAEYPAGTDHPADHEAARLSRALDAIRAAGSQEPSS